MLSFLLCVTGTVCVMACAGLFLMAVCGPFVGLKTGVIARLVLAFLVSSFEISPSRMTWLKQRFPMNRRRIPISDRRKPGISV